MIYLKYFTRSKANWKVWVAGFGFVLLCSLVQAQTVLDTPHTWSSMQHIDLYSNQNITDTVSIYLSNSTLTITNQGISREFPVSDITGTWNNIAQPGEITFHIQVLDLAGNGKLANENGTLTLTIDCSARKDWMYRKFIIANPQ